MPTNNSESLVLLGNQNGLALIPMRLSPFCSSESTTAPSMKAEAVTAIAAVRPRRTGSGDGVMARLPCPIYLKALPITAPLRWGHARCYGAAFPTCSGSV